jgi:electron transport complex protein RnfD
MPLPHIELRTAPHLKGSRSVERIMLQVTLSLLPVCGFFVWQYGLSALALLVVTTLTCLGAERLFNWMSEEPTTLTDFSALITGLLLALSLPPGFPLWMAIIAGFSAIALGKALFGGLGFNVFNPSLVGRAFVQAAFPVAISTWTPSFMPDRFVELIPSTLAAPLMMPAQVWSWVHAHGLDAVSSATPLGRWKFEGVQTPALDMLLSTSSASAVGACPAAIIVCGLYLALRRFLDWRIPVAVLVSAAAAAWIMHQVDPARYPGPLFMLLSGGLMLGAFYMATDPVTSPVTPIAVWAYGALIGVLTVVIRLFSGLPEGVMYAILLGNLATPLMEQFTQPRIFGDARSKVEKE